MQPSTQLLEFVAWRCHALDKASAAKEEHWPLPSPPTCTTQESKGVFRLPARVVSAAGWGAVEEAGAVLERGWEGWDGAGAGL